MNDKNEKQKEIDSPPEISPFLFPLVLAVLGLWCLYDGFFSSDPDMQEHLLFNQVTGCILAVWAAIDFYRTWKSEKAYKKKE